MNLKSFSFATLLLSASLCFCSFAAQHPAKLKEATSRSPITLGKAKPNPGLKKMDKNQLQWNVSSYAEDLSAYSYNGIIRSNPLLPYIPKTLQTMPTKAPAKAATDIPTLMGCVCYADSWVTTGIGKVGIYEIDSSALNEVSLHEEMLTSYGQVYAGDQYFATLPELYSGWVLSMQYNIYDTKDWTESSVPGDYNFNARAMAFDPLTRRAYAITRDEEYYYHFAVMDMDTYSYSTISTMGTEDWAALMCSGEGIVYGMKKDGTFVKFNKNLGEYSVIRETGLASTKMTCGTIDAKTGRCFYIHYTDYISDMYEIDLATGTPTFLFSLPEKAQVISLFVPENAISESAPAKASDLSLDFAKNSLKGNFNFHIPEVSESGNPLQGKVAYTVKINGQESVSGEGNPGENVSCQLEVQSSGEYTFSVVLSNAAGDNHISALTAWIGYAKPDAPQYLLLLKQGDKLNLSWERVTIPGAEDDGVTYSIVAYPSGETVAEGLKENYFNCDVPESEELTRHSFGVRAHYGDSKSEESISNNYVTGYLSLPFIEDFQDFSSMDLFTIVNANNDSHSWEYSFFGGQGRILINYSTSTPHDDWAILHPVKLEGGKIYEIGCDAHGTQWYEEKFEIAVAKGIDKQSLNAAEVILPNVIVSDAEDYAKYSATFTPKESGIYYVGYHAISEPDQNKLYIDNVFITGGSTLLAPSAVTNAAVNADPSGALSAVISFTMPETDIDGNPLTSLSYASIERNGNEIARLEGKAGETISYTDNSPVNGINKYVISAYNSYGRGAETIISAYVGLVEPMKVEDVNVTFGSNPGEAVLTWTAPEYDINDNSLSGTEVTYNVLRSINGSALLEIASGLKETKFTEQVIDPEADQVFVNYFIEAVSVGGVGDRTISNIAPFGRPEKTPARESFGGRETDYEWGAESSSEGFLAWDIYPAYELPFPGYDGGSVAAAYLTYQIGYENATLVSSLFDLSNLENPVVSFYLFDYVDTSNTLRVYVDNGKTCELVSDIEFGELDLEWKRKTVDLSAYKGQIVCLKFEASLVDYNLLAIDNLKISNDADHNLAVLSISAPDTAEANDDFKVTALIENAGKKTAEAYTINLLCDGEILKSVDCSDLKAEELETVEFTVSLPVVSVDNPEFWVEIDYPLDETAEDNTSEKVVVRFLAPSYPAPENLQATVSDNKVLLTWDQPDLNKMVLKPSVDDLESYTPFSTGLETSVVENDNIGEWTTIDVDGLTTYVSEFTYPGVGDPMAFVVYNSYEQEDVVFACHSGHQMFLSLASRPDGDKGNDDWLISPLLAECAQTISFYSKSIDTYGVDDFQVLYSVSGKEISDFVLLESFNTTGDWKEYLVNLPEGTKYFAIRCISYDKYAFLLDDFRMITHKDKVSDLEITGYNVYCDGNCVNESPINETSYTHIPNIASQSTLNYNVACLFNHGESKPSETAQVTMTPSAVSEIAASDITVIGRKGMILIKGAEGKDVSISDSFGRIVYENVPDGEVTISVAAGIYLIKAGNNTSKVIVR
ncbi:MAG: choice-of-anchor J domain-containing protein [Muribaculaceae bacterium]|nr:choice-of-anchor J domain-containing protein [Muribaculaceae bacterium]